MPKDTFDIPFDSDVAGTTIADALEISPQESVRKA